MKPNFTYHLPTSTISASVAVSALIVAFGQIFEVLAEDISGHLILKDLCHDLWTVHDETAGQTVASVVGGPADDAIQSGIRRVQAMEHQVSLGRPDLSPAGVRAIYESLKKVEEIWG